MEKLERGLRAAAIAVDETRFINGFDMDSIPDPEGMENLVGMEKTDKINDYSYEHEAVSAPTFDPRERAKEYFDGMKMSRDEYKTIKRMDREKMQEFFNAYVAQRTQQGMGLYAEIMLGQYLEVLTTVLKDKFGFTEEQVDELNKAVENHGKTETTTGTDENGDSVEVEVVE